MQGSKPADEADQTEDGSTCGKTAKNRRRKTHDYLAFRYVVNYITFWRALQVISLFHPSGRRYYRPRSEQP